MKWAQRFASLVNYDDVVSYDESTPERRLLGAILFRALTDLRSKDTQESRNALHWFIGRPRKGRDKEPTGFTFKEVLEELSFSARQIKIIRQEIFRIYHAKCVSERQAYRERYCELAEVDGLPIGSPECSALRASIGRYYRVG